jgi:hypothetical protein
MVATGSGDFQFVALYVQCISQSKVDRVPVFKLCRVSEAEASTIRRRVWILV